MRPGLVALFVGWATTETGVPVCHDRGVELGHQAFSTGDGGVRAAVTLGSCPGFRQEDSAREAEYF